MNDEELRRHLRELEVPTADPEARERALYEARTVLASRNSIESDDFSPASSGIFQALGVGLAAAALVLFILHVSTPAPSDDLAASRNLLQQFESTFPENLDAVIRRGDEVEVALADEPRPSNDQSLMLTITDQETPVRVLSYSGRKICLDLGGKHVCFEMLLTDSGEVIVSGDDFVWTPENPVRVAGRRIQAARIAQR